MCPLCGGSSTRMIPWYLRHCAGRGERPTWKRTKPDTIQLDACLTPGKPRKGLEFLGRMSDIAEEAEN